MSSIFSKIVQGELPSYKIVEDDRFLAFLDINPNSPGHTLCITKTEVDKIWDLDEETYTGLMQFSRKVALVLESQIACERVGMSVIGLEVPHVHVHLIPLRNMDDARFTTKAKFTEEAFEDLASRLQHAYKQRYGTA